MLHRTFKPHWSYFTKCVLNFYTRLESWTKRGKIHRKEKKKKGDNFKVTKFFTFNFSKLWNKGILIHIVFELWLLVSYGKLRSMPLLMYIFTLLDSFQLSVFPYFRPEGPNFLAGIFFTAVYLSIFLYWHHWSQGVLILKFWRSKKWMMKHGNHLEYMVAW